MFWVGAKPLLRLMLKRYYLPRLKPKYSNSGVHDSAHNFCLCLHLLVILFLIPLCLRSFPSCSLISTQFIWALFSFSLHLSQNNQFENISTLYHINNFLLFKLKKFITIQNFLIFLYNFFFFFFLVYITYIYSPSFTKQGHDVCVLFSISWLNYGNKSENFVKFVIEKTYFVGH